MNSINGFTFNILGELVGKPDMFDTKLLKSTYSTLIRDKQYISASRIQHLINQQELYK